MTQKYDMRQLKALGLVEEFSNSVLIGLYGVESEDDLECSIDFLAVSGVDPSKRQEALTSAIVGYPPDKKAQVDALIIDLVERLAMVDEQMKSH